MGINLSNARFDSLSGFAFYSEAATDLLLDDATINEEVRDSLLGSLSHYDENSIEKFSIVGLQFSDANLSEWGSSAANDFTFDSRQLVIDQMIFESDTDEFNVFAAEAGYTLTVIPYGDTNKDQLVNFADFLTLSANFGSAGRWSDGDFDRDDLVGFSDFLLLSQNFEAEVEAATVPEPSGITILGICCCLIQRWRRRIKVARRQTEV